jgi:hypothetical protein
LKAVACVVTAFDFIRTNNKEISDEGEKFLREWVIGLYLTIIYLDYVSDSGKLLLF